VGRQRFWAAIARGISSEDADIAGLGQAGQRVTDTQAVPVREAPRQQHRVDQRVKLLQKRPFGDPVDQTGYGELADTTRRFCYLYPDYRTRFERPSCQRGGQFAVG
jgi:hypothetical protein